MGNIYFQMGRLDEALAKYNEAIEAKPDLEDVLINRFPKKRHI